METKIDRSDCSRSLDVACDSFGSFMRCLHRSQSPGGWSNLDLTMSQFKALMLIATTGGLSGRDLAQRLSIGPSAVTPLVDRLVQHGYVWREEDASDRRVTWTRPTESGVSLAEGVIAASRARLSDLLSSLTDEEFDLVSRAFDILRAASDRRDQSHSRD
jgi:MarR family transcriptional regulator, organic hydroperoxide resistance regulator